ncbi:DNA-binding response OmpR family regulator [Silvibacterium bohemicum]|uniref:DNA-binding response OmpR family regulator n=1 Tax=Silvibacterium bohemicum TaxID=1577686 RepID=A0A841K2B4_9BACT|nr:response regulator transcription factor [Silvibacterium bohemicum]MBB6144384.1 DNA-binding response OmpR family regulator [Silvibacterium bohemicum]
MNSIHSILLVDDEPVVADGLQRTLRNFGFEVQLADNAETARQMVENSKFDLILVDFDLGPKNDPKLSVSGTGLVFELRAAKVGLPILMYTVLEGEWYELASLHAGADGYILKSTSIQLLISRLHAHIRRYERDTGKRRSTTHRLGVGRFVLDRNHQVLADNEKSMAVTQKEARILEILATNPARVVTSQELLDGAWGRRDLDKTLDSLRGVIKRFRKKLDDKGFDDLIQNVRGQGFRLQVPPLGTTDSASAFHD